MRRTGTKRWSFLSSNIAVCSKPLRSPTKNMEFISNIPAHEGGCSGPKLGPLTNNQQRCSGLRTSTSSSAAASLPAVHSAAVVQNTSSNLLTAAGRRTGEAAVRSCLWVLSPGSFKALPRGWSCPWRTQRVLCSHTHPCYLLLLQLSSSSLPEFACG